MSDTVLAEVMGAVPMGEEASLDLRIGAGLTVLLGSDEERLSRYLKMVAGVEPAARGSVTLLGQTPADETYGGRSLRRTVGYVTPQAPLLSVLDGVRNVMLPALYHRLGTEQEVIPKVQALLDEMECECDHRALPAYMTELHQRLLLLARALILQPRLLFTDEPLKGLENHSRDRLRSYLLNKVAARVESLVVAGNDPVLASSARQVVFIGATQHRIYDGWAALLASTEPDVQDFIERERRFCSVLQG